MKTTRGQVFDLVTHGRVFGLISKATLKDWRGISDQDSRKIPLDLVNHPRNDRSDGEKRLCRPE